MQIKAPGLAATLADLALDIVQMRQSSTTVDSLPCGLSVRTGPMTKIYGIRNCDTMKRAFAWLEQHQVEYAFHDYKKAGVTAAMLETWASRIGWEKLLNTRGTTWRRLSEDDRANLDAHKALRLMQQQPSLIKRPVLAHGKELLVGFDAGAYEKVFG